MRRRFHTLRLAEAPPHPDLLHSPSKTGVNALMARGEKETAAQVIVVVVTVMVIDLSSARLRKALI